MEIRRGGRIGTWIRLDNWLSDAAHLPVRHLLIVLDACHSGIALAPVVRWRGENIAATEPIEHLRMRRSRRIITSALDDQLAMDSGPVPGHSLFTGCLIEALTGGLVATIDDSLVTGTEIGHYVQRRVATYPNSKQTPDFGTLELDDRGELVLRLPMSPATRPRLQATVPTSTLVAPTVRTPLAEDTSSSSQASHEMGRPVRWGALRSLAIVVAILVPLITSGVVVSQLYGAHRDRGNADPDVSSAAVRVPRDASLDEPHDSSPEAPWDAATGAQRLVDIITNSNPFASLGALHVQAHQVTRGEYAAYLATLSEALRHDATPVDEWSEARPGEPVSWTRFEQAVAFCTAIDARLPTFDEWQHASNGAWGLDPTGSNRLGPLREWTSERTGDFVRVAGATAAMTKHQRERALSETFQLATAGAFADRPVPDATDVGSKEVGIRCVR